MSSTPITIQHSPRSTNLDRNVAASVDFPALDVPLSTVKSRLYTALKQLQLRLQKFESGN